MHYGCASNVGIKLRISLQQLVIELGLSEQPFQESFEAHKDLVTWSWLVSLWEKCDLYGVRILLGESLIKRPRERDRWLMSEFKRVGYSGQELVRLNRVRCHQQVLILSDIVTASGRSLDERYLRKRPNSEQWSSLNSQKKRSPLPLTFK